MRHEKLLDTRVIVIYTHIVVPGRSLIQRRDVCAFTIFRPTKNAIHKQENIASYLLVSEKCDIKNLQRYIPQRIEINYKNAVYCICFKMISEYCSDAMVY